MSKKLYDSYKTLEYLDSENKSCNYFEELSIQILNTLKDMKDLHIKYENFKSYFSKNIILLNLVFEEIKVFLWTRFCNQMRDYSDLIFGLLSNDKTKIELKDKYREIYDYILKTKFINCFVSSPEKYAALSFALHNMNIHNYGKEKSNRTFDEYSLFNETIKISEINLVKNEFEYVIHLFRKIEDYEYKNVSIILNTFFPIYNMLEFLIDKRNKY